VTRYVVVTGTDTDVGKTFVTEALARRWSRDRAVVAIKPFESGAAAGEGDGERLARATGQRAPTHALIQLGAPLAPAVAAEREGVTIDFDALVIEIRALGDGADVVLVEGAGGVLSPLTWDHDVLDLARALDALLVLVASDRLGTISATHAAVHVMHARGLLPTAIVLGAPAVPDASTGSNADALRRRLASLGDVGAHLVTLPRTDLAAAAEPLVPLGAWLGLS
jgi:dethiobiotin synthetase